MINQDLMNLVNPKLVRYVEEKIFPEYEKNDEGHRVPHILYVIRRSLEFAGQFEKECHINLDMCYAAAAYHDIGHHIDKDRHEEISAQLFWEDETMEYFFTEEERSMIEEAIEEHRSSLKRAPTSVYGKILSSADRSIDFNTSLRRTHAYSLKHFPDFSIYEMVKRSYNHIKEKYGKNGYAKTYVVDEEFEKNKQEVEKFIANPTAFFTRYLEVNKLYPSVGIEEELVISLLGKKHYSRLKNMHYRKYELAYMREGVTLLHPLVIEFTGMPRTGKTSVIHSVKDFFQKAGFKVSLIEEYTSSEYYKAEIKPKLLNENMTLGEVNLFIMGEVYEQLMLTLSQEVDIVLVDRGINDRQIWNYLRLKSGDILSTDYAHYTQMYAALSHDLVNLLVVTDAEPNVVLKRDFASCMALEKRHFLTSKNLNEFSAAMKAKKELLEDGAEKVFWVNTNERTIESTMLSVTNEILNIMKEKYAERLVL